MAPPREEIRADLRDEGDLHQDGPASRSVTGPRVALRGERPELVALNAFLERSGDDMDRDGLREWFETHLVERGIMPLPAAAYEHGVGAVPLGSRSSGRTTSPNPGPCRELIKTARERVIAAAQGLLMRPPRDGFVVASLVRGRVRRCSEEASYIPSPSTGDALSDVVLALLACDVLRFRDQYDTRLRICDRCGTLAFDTAGNPCLVCGDTMPGKTPS